MVQSASDVKRTGPGRPREFSTEAAALAAADVFWEYGYNAASIDDICKRTGLLRGSLYGAFGDKKGILLAALEHYSKRTVARLAQFLEKPGKEGVREALMCYARTASSLEGTRSCLVTNTALEVLPRGKDIHAKIEQIFHRMEALLTDAVARGQVTGLFSKKLTAQAAGTFLLSVIQGIRVLGKVRYKESDLRLVVEMALHALT
jgi:TetR/AcrR family transcriptional regulator, transcriptional repressor for nem operon